jgi:hypothetical protein
MAGSGGFSLTLFLGTAILTESSLLEPRNFGPDPAPVACSPGPVQFPLTSSETGDNTVINSTVRFLAGPRYTPETTGDTPPA